MAYWINIVRQPLMGTSPDLSTYVVTLAMAVVGWFLTIWVTRTYADKLPFWI